ncbi:MAG: hypothetical protein RIQ93_1313 [Verrucomicrobiota bacterium]|jgi:PAS domain S-box-containing protein
MDVPHLLGAEQAQLFANALPQLAWMARPDGYLFWCNRRWHEYTGTTAVQMEGWGWQSVHDPVTLPTVVKVWQESIRTGAPFEMEFPLRGADGLYRPFLTRAEPVRDAAGTLLYWVGTNTDVSHQKSAQSTLRLALDAAYLVAFVWDIPTNTVQRYHNDAAMLRGTTEKADSFEAIRAMVYPEDRALFEANVQKALNDPEGSYFSEFRFIGLDRKVRWLLERGRVSFGADGKPLRLTGLSQDITDRKEAELRLVDAQEQLRRHNQDLEAAVADRTAKLQELVNELDSFSYSVSHDLRAPLRSIQGFAALLEEELAHQLPAGARDHLDRIIRAAERMSALIRDLLEYSRITRAELLIESIDPTDIIGEAADAQQHERSPEAKIELRGPFPRVQANRPALAQALSNLLGNAVKFVAPGVTPHVTVWAEASDATVRLWVEDNGIGIAPRDQDRMWGMLERANSTYDGAGIGLSIVRKAVERMGGRAGVISQLGQGSRFWIELPKARSS